MNCSGCSTSRASGYPHCTSVMKLSRQSVPKLLLRPGFGRERRSWPVPATRQRSRLALESRGQYNEAIAAFRKSVELAPEKAEAWQQYNEAAILQIVVENLPALASAVASPLAKTERIVVIGGGADGSAGASKVTQDVTNVIAQLPPVIQALTGVNLQEILGKLPDAVKSAAAGRKPVEHKPEPKAEEPKPAKVEQPEAEQEA